MKEDDLSFKLKDIETAYTTLMRAKALAEKGKNNEAEIICKELITNFPKYYAAHRELAKIYIEQKQFYSAFQHLALALSGDQSDYFSLLNMEALFYEFGMYETGRDFSTLIDIIGDKKGIRQHSEVHIYNKGKLLLKNKEYEKAANEFINCLLIHPDNEDIAINLIECYEAIGEIQKALNIIEKFISKNGGKRNTFIYLASTLPQKLIQNNLIKYTKFLERITVNDNEEIQRLFALARFYHMGKRYGQAWETIIKANDSVKLIIKDKYLDDKRWEEEFLSWARNTDFDVPPIAEDEPDTLPLYMLGPSRSGKSCLEKALDWLPGVKLGFENKLLSNATSRTFNAGDRLPATFLPFLPESLLTDFVFCYRAMFRENARGASLYTTTTPGLITSVPAIMYALPKAKFIFLKRNPLDTAFRMYFKYYRNSHYHSCDIDWSLGYIQWYYDLVGLWEQKFPRAVLTVAYADLVSRPMAELKRILAFLGISADVPEDLAIPNDSGFSDPYHALYNKKEEALPPL